MKLHFGILKIIFITIFVLVSFTPSVAKIIKYIGPDGDVLYIEGTHCPAGYLSEQDYLLKDKKQPLETRDKKQLPKTEGKELSSCIELYLAVHKGDIYKVRILIEQGMNPDTRVGGTSVLMEAAHEGHYEIVQLLLEHGADIDAKDVEYGRNSLSWALRGGHVKTVRLLLENGADTNTEDRAAIKSLLKAASNGHSEPIEPTEKKAVVEEEVGKRDKIEDSTISHGKQQNSELSDYFGSVLFALCLFACIGYLIVLRKRQYKRNVSVLSVLKKGKYKVLAIVSALILLFSLVEVMHWRSLVPEFNAKSINSRRISKRENLKKVIEKAKQGMRSNEQYMAQFLRAVSSNESLIVQASNNYSSQESLRHEIARATKSIREIPPLINIYKIKKIPLTDQQKKAKLFYLIGSIFIAVYIIFVIVCLITFRKKLWTEIQKISTHANQDKLKKRSAEIRNVKPKKTERDGVAVTKQATEIDRLKQKLLTCLNLIEKQKQEEFTMDGLSQKTEIGKLIECPDCLKPVSRRAVACPNCGCPIKDLDMPGSIVPHFPKSLDDQLINKVPDLNRSTMNCKPKCPHCGSSNFNKITLTNKAGSALLVGVLAIGHVTKTFKCADCGYKW